MGNFISKNHRIATAKSLSEGVGEKWYGFIASPEGTEAVNSTNDVSLDKLRRQILAHSPIGDNNFALMANYTPNTINNDLIALADLSYYGQKPDDDGTDVVIDYNQVDIKVYKVLYKDKTGSDGEYIKKGEFSINGDVKPVTNEFKIYDVDGADSGNTVNIIYKYIGKINSDDVGNFYLPEENIFPVIFELNTRGVNSNPGGVEWITKNGTITFDTTKNPGITDGVYPAILNGDGVSGKAEVTTSGAGANRPITSIRVVDAGKYFKDATKLKLSYTDNTDISVDIDTDTDPDVDTRINYFTFGKISPPEGHGIKPEGKESLPDEFEIAKQFSFVGLKFYTKISATDLEGKVSSGIKFRTTGLFRKRDEITGNPPVYTTDTNGINLGVVYKQSESDAINGVFDNSSQKKVSISNVDANHNIIKNIYIKVDGKIFKIIDVSNSTITINDTTGLLDSYIAGLTSGAGSFKILEARGVGVSNNHLQVIPNKEGIYQLFRAVGFENINDSTDTKSGQASESGPDYADIMSFDTDDSFHIWKTGNNIYFSQIILL